MKQIQMTDVANISMISPGGNHNVLFTLSNGNAYYANGDVDIVKDVYYCYYGFTTWTNTH